MRQTVLVTGASSGIGLLIANKFHANGYNVIGTSRNPENYQSTLPFKIMKKLSILLLIFVPVTNVLSQRAEGDRILGVWLNEDKDAKVEVYKSGDKYFGKLIWGKEMYEADGKTSRKDVKNKDGNLKSRNLRDLVMLSDFVFRDGVWDKGEIYDPVSGNTYSCTIKLKGNKLDIRGYLGISLFGRTTVWESVK